ncbi:MAG: T9SS type A sorting domain-containing protein [Prolixibacteraceae bacterium]|jgi:hypothetical protein|nr:T9SS type A sorting domain-containing protein [Prolixibacteraceae bacterium]MBT6763247.1 T9SS type A sorting domain-containing protein [Prolixibacteraceae bacterium]MBT7397223.1 T9SS type A sorting domain-containing protein [Prolixibacteraceae bacterium]
MKNILHFLTGLLLLLCINVDLKAQTYVGSNECKTCHTEKYDDWAASGHPYKFNVTPENVGPVYPAEAINFQSTWLENLGDGTHDWGDIAGVIGGYGWKTRFVGIDGHIIGSGGSSFSTGLGHNQFNFYGGEDHGWVDYEASNTNKIYNYSCFKCHTTGGTTEGSWLENVDGLGNFSEGGIGCEACHGPGSTHIANPTIENIDLVYEQVHLDNSLGGLSVNGLVQTPDPNGNDVNFMCGTCHNRSYTDPINSSGGFIKHHEQWDEFTATKHGAADLTCSTCHDPHKRTIWDGDGIIKTCTTCHNEHAETVNHATGVTCIDCHMPFAAKSGTTRGESGFKADVRSHIVSINTSTESMFTADGSAIKDDETRKASLSPHFACLGCHNDDSGDDIPDKTIEQVAAAAAGMHTIYTADDYRGSESCQACHTEKYNDWAASGHPYKFTVTPENLGPVYPAEAINFQSTWLENLGDGTHNWGDVAGVIGGYGWKTRFVGTDGHVIGSGGSAFSTGLGHNQFNFYGGEDHGWVNYETSNTNKLYNYSCFKCHTTGGDTEGTWLEGVEGLGTFTEGGVGCEACHGPGALHASAPTKENIDLVYEQAHLDNSLGGLSINGVVQTPDANGNDVNFMCGTCHNRSYTDPINSSGGFIKHHEQWDEFTATEHGEYGFSCVTCHDPHKRTIWDGDGITKTCESCHDYQSTHVKHSAGVSCIDCHMPFAAKSGTTRGESGYKGDVRSHLFTINTSTESMFTEDGSAVKDDETREAALSPHFACLGCHNDDPNDNIPDKTIEQAAAFSKEMHAYPTSANLTAFDSALKIYPNPSKGSFYFSMKIDEPGNAYLRIFDITGKNVYTTIHENNFVGINEIIWDGKDGWGTDINPGFYFVEINVGNKSFSGKIIKL